MLDIHSHILPDLDDGASGIAESLDMLRSAHRAGVSAIVATPHSGSHRRSLRTPTIAGTLAELAQAAADDPEASAVKLYVGSEIMLDPGVRAALDAGNLPTLGGDTRFALVELPMLEVPRYAEDVLFELAAAGYVPVLAHPERNHELSRRFDIMLQMIRRGTLMQVEAGSVVGGYGSIAQECALEMLDRRMCHFIASDAHRPGAYDSLVPQAIEAVTARVGEEVAAALFRDNPATALADQRPIFPDPISDDEWRELRRARGERRRHSKRAPAPRRDLDLGRDHSGERPSSETKNIFGWLRGRRR